MKPQYIARLSIEDLEDRGYEVEKITERELANMASKMGDWYVGCCFWEGIEAVAEFYGLKSKTKSPR